MQWLEISIDTKAENIDGMCGILELMDIDGVVIEDEADLNDFVENEKKYWDYIDDEVFKRLQGVCRIKFYLEDNDEGRERLGEVRRALGVEPTVTHVRDEDWENNWREYYKPIAVGEKLIVVPQWLECEDTGRIRLNLDPGLIFGTGEHATTQMCLRALEKYVETGDSLLDLGCGSGILAIAGILLGCGSAAGCDIDEKALKVVMENAELNNIGEDQLKIYIGDILTDEALQAKFGKYRVVTANIVADVIIGLCPVISSFMEEDGVFICSGIIDGREGEVLKALETSSLEVIESFKQDNWHCFVARLRP